MQTKDTKLNKPQQTIHKLVQRTNKSIQQIPNYIKNYITHV